MPIQHKLASAAVYLRTKSKLDPSSRLATIDMGQTLCAVLLWGGGLDPHLTQCSLSCPVCPVCDVGVLWPNGWMDVYRRSPKNFRTEGCLIFFILENVPFLAKLIT